MAFSENISLQNYVDDANQRFQETESRLSDIEGSFQTRMNGKTTGGLIGSIFGTVCWLVVFFASFWYVREYVDRTLGLFCLGIAVVLIISLIIDEIIGFSYYGKIASYKNNITQLKNRVSVGRSSINSNQDAFIKSRANGWNHPLPAGTSIPVEAASIESTMNGMESLKAGFINGFKNCLFFAFVIVITGIGSWALFDTAGAIITGITDEYLDSDTLMTLCVIGLLIAEGVEIFLAKKVWSATDCTVTNTTLWIAPMGPLLFLLLVAVATLLVMLVILVVNLVIGLVTVVFGLAIVVGIISCIEGG